MVYVYNASADSMFLYLSSVLFSNLNHAKLWFSNLDMSYIIKILEQYFYWCIFGAILILGIISYAIFSVYKSFFTKKTAYLLITHRDINSKTIYNILLCKIVGNCTNILKNLTSFQYSKNINKDDINRGHVIHFLSVKDKKNTSSLYSELKNLLIYSNEKSIDIFIYDTHDRYIDTFCALCGERSLMQQSSFLVKKKYIFKAQIDKINARFYLVDDLLKEQNSISVLQMLQSIEPEYQALQEIYYYNGNNSINNSHIIPHLLSIAYFVVRKLN